MFTRSTTPHSCYQLGSTLARLDSSDISVISQQLSQPMIYPAQQRIHRKHRKSESRPATALQMLIIPLLLSVGLFTGTLLATVGIEVASEKLADIILPSTAQTHSYQ